MPSKHAAWALILVLSPAQAQNLARDSQPPEDTAATQLTDDSYTRYELLVPGSAKFRILYWVSATDAGATKYFNPIRKGSRASDERVTDLATGKPLPFRIVPGTAARAAGSKNADPEGEYVQVTLARPVPKGGEGRILIDKTYEDAKSYFVEGDTIVFSRPLGIDRNAVVLPAGYRLTYSSMPAQVLQERDGRIKVSFIDVSPAQSPLVIKARPAAVASGPSSVPAARLDERAAQTREIVYYLQQPETHRFDLSHDYTETKAGVGTYVNVVRAGSSVADPGGMVLDTGAPLRHKVLRGAAITRAAPDTKDVTPETEAVVFSFPPVPRGGSTRIRITETYTDPERYKMVGDELVWDRTFGRAANAVVLPAGWALTNSSAPAITSELPDGRVRLDFLNPRTDELQVLITARRIVSR
ncbi:hypothetical protein H9L13_04620 [Sphingomonas lutea]|uniref:Uncharacterized protein n=1 Tax=Sphingomonas lutea TaxID=1045317 RepID=A0A7G9SJZ5_9SPHN|nr:hypothetical protein [Sphingomonas lutea]QNN68170.1 hypothetical protein H9L13_04620 [Sphingomonas lutea]